MPSSAPPGAASVIRRRRCQRDRREPREPCACHEIGAMLDEIQVLCRSSAPAAKYSGSTCRHRGRAYCGKASASPSRCSGAQAPRHCRMDSAPRPCRHYAACGFRSRRTLASSRIHRTAAWRRATRCPNRRFRERRDGAALQRQGFHPDLAGRACRRHRRRARRFRARPARRPRARRRECRYSSDSDSHGCLRD